MDLTTLLVAAVGLAGTLTSPVLAQRLAARTKQQELDHQRQQQREEQEETRRQSSTQLKRTTYAQLNTAARQYQQQLEAHLRLIENDEVDDKSGRQLDSARKKFRDLYSEAQMVLPDVVLDAAVSTSAALGDAYGMAKRLESGKPRTSPDQGTETVESAQEFAHVTVYDHIVHMRHLMRVDLGVSDPEDST